MGNVRSKKCSESSPDYSEPADQNRMGEPSVNVDYEFKTMENGTLVVIKSYGFSQTGEDLLKVINDNTGGFTTVLDGCKAYLEHRIKLNLIEDKFPQK